MNLKLHFDDGGYVEFPSAGAAQADTVTQWYREAEADQVLRLRADDGTTVWATKRHICRIVVAE